MPSRAVERWEDYLLAQPKNAVPKNAEFFVGWVVGDKPGNQNNKIGLNGRLSSRV
jgi:hypothetical protein